MVEQVPLYGGRERPMERARFQKLHFVGYLVHFWHHALEFKRMKEFGDVAPDEPFMMSGFIQSYSK